MEEVLQGLGLLKGTLYDVDNVTIVHHLNQALKAHALFRRDRDYIVKCGRGRHHRRVHRPHDAGPALLGRPASGARGQGAGRDPAREPDAGADHVPELLPPLQEARRHDRHGADRSRRVHGHLRPRRDRGADQRRRSPASTRTTRSTAPPTRSGRRSSPRSSARRSASSRFWSARSRSRRASMLSELLKAKGITHQVLNARYHEQEADHHRPGRRARHGDDRHQHGRPRHRHPARRQRRVPPQGLDRGARGGGRRRPTEQRDRRSSAPRSQPRSRPTRKS